MALKVGLGAEDRPLTAHFMTSEFRCPCCHRCDMDAGFMLFMERLRMAVGRPVVVTSGFRCERKNVIIGGAPGSSHMKGIAADIAVNGSVERYQIVRVAMDLGAYGIGVYKTWVHVDTDSKKRKKPCLWLSNQ